MKKLVIGGDHASPELKALVAAHLRERGFDVEDIGTFTTASCDYPVIAHQLCGMIQRGEREFGILICGTGIGMSMVANKHRGIRAACCSDTFSARLTRQHNDANVLCFGARVVGPGLALELVDAFVDAEFEGGKHARRLQMAAELETEEAKK